MGDRIPIEDALGGDDATRIIIDYDPDWDTKDQDFGDDVLHIAVATEEQFDLFYVMALVVLEKIQREPD